MASAQKDVAPLTTPAHCIADFCLIPIGTSSPSVSKQIADVNRLVNRSSLKFSLHSAGTTLEGSWDDVMRLIGQAHSLLHESGTLRIQTDIRVGSRTDKVQSFVDKVAKVEQIISAENRKFDTN